MKSINQEYNKKALLGKLGETRYLAKQLGFESVSASLSALLISLSINEDKITSQILTEYYEGANEFFEELQDIPQHKSLTVQ